MRQLLAGNIDANEKIIVQAEARSPIAHLRAGWTPITVVTEPTGAHIQVKNYSDVDGPWEDIGVTPLPEVRLPFAYYRMRVTKSGYRTLEVSALLTRQPVKLTPESDAAPGMVFVPGIVSDTELLEEDDPRSL